METVMAVVGARPQFIKHAAVELASRGKLRFPTIHTGQHFDATMSKVFFDDLGIAKPEFQLAAGGQTHGKQTATMLQEIEEIVMTSRPDGLLVYGDTNSTLAGALVAAKLHIPLFHVESGLRSYNKSMPEEINRILTDHCSDYLFTTSQAAVENLKKEGITENVLNVGDVMYDMVLRAKEHIRPVNYNDFYYCTLHRPSNVDDPTRLKQLVVALNELGKTVVFPIHPRTKSKLLNSSISLANYERIVPIEPVSYFDNIALLAASNGLITDSGGMQKEAYWLRKQCVTIRNETEWTETLRQGWNVLKSEDITGLAKAFEQVPTEYEPLYGDGNAAEKITDTIASC